MAGRFTVESVFKAVDRVTAPVSRMQNSVGKFTRSMERGLRGVNRTMSRVGSGIKKAARTTVVAIGLIAASMAVAASTGLNFEQAIANIAAVSLTSVEAIKPLKELALELGRTTRFTATEAANAMEVLSRSGFNTQQIMQATPAILSAAAASGLEIAEVADHVSNVLKGMGLEMTDAGRVADVLALASSKTNSTIGSLGESMRNVASTARHLNVPLEQVVASVALLQDVGLDASVAGSAFNTMLTKMAAPSKSLAKEMKLMGISFKNANGDMLSLPDVLQQLDIASEKVGGNFDQIAFFAELVGLRGQKAALNLAKLFETGRLEKLNNTLDKAHGSADKMAKIRMDTTSGSLLLLSSAVDAVKVSIFDLNKGPLKDTIDSMTKWVSINEKFISTKVDDFIDDLTKIINRENLPTMIKWTKRIGIAIGVFILFKIVLSSLILVMTALNIVMALNPIVLLTLAILAAIAIFAALVIWIDEITAAFDDLNPTIRLLLLPLELFLRGIKFIKDVFTEGFDHAFSELGGWIDNLAASFDDLHPIIRLSIAPLEALIRGIKFIKDFSTEGFGHAIKELGGSFGLFNDDDNINNNNDNNTNNNARIVSPQDRIARSIEEKRITNENEITVKIEGGKAEVTRQQTRGFKLAVQDTGGF